MLKYNKYNIGQPVIYTEQGKNWDDVYEMEGKILSIDPSIIMNGKAVYNFVRFDGVVYYQIQEHELKPINNQ